MNYQENPNLSVVLHGVGGYVIKFLTSIMKLSNVMDSI